MTRDKQTDVLICGAGPTGLALAAELRRLGVEPMVVDRQAEGANTSRACVIHARTLEALAPLGVAPDLLAAGVEVPLFRIRDGDQALMTLDFRGLPTPYAFSLMCPQDRTEAVLLDHLRRLGGEVIRPCVLQDVEVGEHGVVAQVAGETVHAKWLVGCDGMHSRVRELAGVRFEGADYSQAFVLADVVLDWPLDREEVTLFVSPEGFMVVSPLPGGAFRVVAPVDEAPEHPSLAYVQALLESRGPQRRTGKIREMLWTSRFRIHHRVAETPRRGRILLCGDAAHVHSPAGGQGMNTGLQDAVSLAAELAATLRDGQDARLDDWARRRHEIASEVVAFTDRMTRMATLSSPLAKAVRNTAIRLVGQIPAARGQFAMILSELKYR